MRPSRFSVFAGVTRWVWLLVAAILLIGSTASHARWNADWSVRKKITIDTSASGAQIDAPIGTAAVLVRLYDGNFQFALAKEDGSDIRFLAEDDKTLLTYHIERYDGLMNEAFVWVKIPDLKPGAKTSIWLYYGNTGPKATSVNDPKGTFDADTVLVYHFGENGAPAADATSNGNNAKAAGVKVEGALIAGGTRFTGQTPIVIPESPSLTWTANGTLTWSAWIKPATLAPNAVIFSRKEGTNGLVIGADNGVPYIEVTTEGAVQRTPAGTPVTVNAWHHLALVADGAKSTFYVDGEQYASLAVGLPALNSALALGGSAPVEGAAPAADAPAGFAGEFDELQISRVARPAGLIKLAALSQGSDKASKLLSFGADEHEESWFSGGYFGVIISSLTVDGWVVICILGVMFAISWWVMLSKGSYLNKNSKGNALFMKEWGHIATDLTMLDHGNAENVKTLGGRINDRAGQRTMRNSSVYRIYHIGSEEIQHRLAADHSSNVLSARSIQAIRASLDGGLVRETQKLNDRIVLLTICISGGPFLGLLGTVVGVMITFAAVAAAGDVNVNAIAPGIAAALLATVAGLAVAIPSLFGYNYLLSRIKDATSDMHVFIDEFVTKMAEFYSETEEGGRQSNRKPATQKAPLRHHSGEPVGAH